MPAPPPCPIVSRARQIFTPYTVVTNNVPLDQMNPDPKKVSHQLLWQHAYASVKLPLDAPDQCPGDLFNRILWHATKGPDAAYPEWAIRKHDDEDDDD